MSESAICNILFIADVVGKAGYETLAALLPGLFEKYQVDFCIANGENGYVGKGLTENIARNYFRLGIDIITGGNHTWNVGEFKSFLDTSSRVLRPLNYPDEVPGRGATLAKSRKGVLIGVVNLQGRTFMYPIDCPFKKGMEQVQKLRHSTPLIIVDFHAEATAEKVALGWYLDGQVSALIGTHTHVQTADERILPGGTAYITDAGMTGPHHSVIGLEKNVAIKRFIMQIPERYQVAVGDNRLCGVIVQVDVVSGRAKSITRINQAWQGN